MRLSGGLIPTYVLILYLFIGTICSIPVALKLIPEAPASGSLIEFGLLIFPYSLGYLLGVIDISITGRFFDLSPWVIPTLWALALGCGWGGFVLNRRHGAVAGWLFFGAVVVLGPATLALGWLSTDCLRSWGPEFCRIMRTDPFSPL